MMRKKKPSSFNGRFSSDRLPRVEEEGGEEDEHIEWEMRPGGMLVQKRSSTSKSSFDSSAAASLPKLRLRIAYGSIRYEISVAPISTFGELKKLVSTETGLQPGEQRLIFRGKEREDGEYLDVSGVKDRSKVILMEDPSSREKRFIEMRKNAKVQSAHRAISDISMEVDKLMEQVSTIEKSISNGNKVAEVQITTLIEMLMMHAIKLDSISTEGVVSEQKKLQSKRVQKCVETLDMLKFANVNIKAKPAFVTASWETFEPPTTTTKPTAPHWEFFD